MATDILCVRGNYGWHAHYWGHPDTLHGRTAEEAIGAAVLHGYQDGRSKVRWFDGRDVKREDAVEVLERPS